MFVKNNDLIMERLEYEQKRKEVLEKFTQEFISGNYPQNATLHKIVEYLIRGANPYDIIEQLINNQENLIEELKTQIENKPIVIHKQ